MVRNLCDMFTENAKFMAALAKALLLYFKSIENSLFGTASLQLVKTSGDQKQVCSFGKLYLSSFSQALSVQVDGECGRCPTQQSCHQLLFQVSCRVCDSGAGQSLGLPQIVSIDTQWSRPISGLHRFPQYGTFCGAVHVKLIVCRVSEHNLIEACFPDGASSSDASIKRRHTDVGTSRKRNLIVELLLGKPSERFHPRISNRLSTIQPPTTLTAHDNLIEI